MVKWIISEVIEKQVPLFNRDPRFCVANPAGIYLLKGNNRNTRNKRWNMFKVNNEHMFKVNFEHISHLVLVFLLLTLSKWMPARKVLKRIRNVLKKDAIKK